MSKNLSTSQSGPELWTNATSSNLDSPEKDESLVDRLVKPDKPIFLVYDSQWFGSPGSPNKGWFYDFLGENGMLVVWNWKSIQDGPAVFEVRQALRELSDRASDKTYSFIWNGGDAGCESFKKWLKTFGLAKKFAYVEQGLLPQKENMRMLLFPVDQEINLSHPIVDDSTFEKGISENEVSIFVDQCLSRTVDHEVKRDKVKKGKICIIAQLSGDVSLFPLKNPSEDFPQKIKEKILDIYGDDAYSLFEKGELELVICPHPRDKDNVKKFNLNLLPKHTISEKSTVEACIDAELAIGFNSTTLYELFFKDIPVEALWENHPLNFNKTKKSLGCKIGMCQFDPRFINLNNFLEKVNYFSELRKVNNLP